jgi:hypothetical protein
MSSNEVNPLNYSVYDKQLIADLNRELGAKYQLEEDSHARSARELLSFETLFNPGEDKMLIYVLNISDGKRNRICQHLILHDSYYFKNGGGRNTQLYTLMRLPFDAGDILIRPENLMDKAVELVHKMELDFPTHAEFSSRYYVLSNDKDKAGSLLNDSVLELINEFEGMWLEIHGKEMVVSFRRHTNTQEAMELTGFAERFLAAIS